MEGILKVCSPKISGSGLKVTHVPVSFAFPMVIPKGANEKETRRAVREFVDHYGANGRVLASIQSDRSNPLQGQIAQEELYNYSLEYYNKLYGRG